jgi:mono/diheme cytochrome c family protein
MPRKPPAEPIDHHYNIERLTRAFVYSGLVLLLFSVAMIWTDYARGWSYGNGWKGVQLRFLAWDDYKTKTDMAAAREKVSLDEFHTAQAQLAQARAQQAQHRKEIREAQKRVEGLQGQWYASDQTYRFAKAELDTRRYELEDAEAAGKPSAIESRRKAFEGKKAELDADQLALQEKIAGRDAAKAEVERLTVAESDSEKKIKTLLSAYDLAEAKRKTLRQDSIFKARNAPILDMINPSIKLQQVILPDLFNDVNFMKIPRVDRCVTCHIAADKKGYTADVLVDKNGHPIPEVYRSHSNPSLIAGSDSPHSYVDFGCTSCHGGRDRSTSFFHTAHQPSSEKEGRQWKRQYDWELDEFVEMPITPIRFAQSGCYRCHSSEVNFPSAPRLDAGMRVIESLGCWGCHRIKGLEGQHLPKGGPSLAKLAGKVTPEWTMRWISNPRAFRASTKMPRFFFLDNFVHREGIDPKTGKYHRATPAQARENEEGRLQNETMIQAITAYLFDKSQHPIIPALDRRGDPVHGKFLFESRGCLGCHVLDPAARRDLIGTWRQFGPNLAGVGSKDTREWIAAWIKDPKAWNPETKMPNLRLTDEETADLAEYLWQQKDPSEPGQFGSTPLPRIDKTSLDRIALYFETTNKSIVDARKDIAGMSLPQELAYAGEKLITHYGCYACHAIPGFEDAKPIGTELSEWGNKAVHRLDFGFVEIEHTRQDFLWTKLTNTRIWDQDKVRGWEEKLKMPLFSFSTDEKDAIVTAVLGFQKDDMADAKRKRLLPEEVSIERGRRLVKDHNCQGCHVIEGRGGSIRDTMADVSLAPPIIKGEGAKVQSDWLFQFLLAPRTGQIRPWLQVHMPTFAFSDEDLNDLTKYFASLSKASYPFLLADYPTDPRSIAAGRKVFEMYRCAQCHPRSQQDLEKVADKSSLAPNLQMARARLRHDWINDWIVRPDDWMPGTRMPTNFPVDDTTHQRNVTLAMGWDFEQLASDRKEIEGIWGSPQEASAFIHSVDRVTGALRDYVWSIGSAEAAPAEAAPHRTRRSRASARATSGSAGLP